jgi:pimeloyl-ACP methyl ester carboxylesterase
MMSNRADCVPTRDLAASATSGLLARAPARDQGPALVVHGRRDRFFPVGNGEAIAREISGARLLVLKEDRFI